MKILAVVVASSETLSKSHKNTLVQKFLQKMLENLQEL
jgi:hypothetical protein